VDIREFTRKNRDGILLGIILLSSLVAMMIQSSRFTSIPQRIGMGITSGIETGMSGIQNFVVNTVRSVSELRDLREEYNSLSERLDESQQIFRSMEALEEENRVLREALGFSRSMDYQNIPGRIIGKDPGIVFTSLMVNRGSRHGIRVGMAVVGYQNGEQGLIGKVIETSAFTCLVRPIVDPLSYVSARLSRTRYEGLLRGRGSDSESMIMEYLDRESRNQITVGDEIITSGLNSLYPPNLRIGTVSAILGTSYETSLQLEVRPFISFTRLESVFFLATTGEPDPERRTPLFIPGDGPIESGPAEPPEDM
jgi:rod shape-determining protein MreC